MPHNLGNLFEQIAGGPDNRAAGVERLVRTAMPLPPGQQRPASDSEGTSGDIRHAIDRGPTIAMGRIVDAVAYTHMYKVQVDDGGPILSCADMVHTSLGVFGAKQLNTYALGAGVIVLLLDQVEYGIILGAHPDHGVDARSALSDQISTGANVGLHTDDVHKFPFQLVARGGIADWSSGRPYDSLTVGEWGATSETGLMVFLDPFLAMMKADEETGLWVFYHDHMTRLAGHNLQIRATGYERESLDDQGEASTYEGWAPYLHEARGSMVRGGNPTVSLSAEISQQLSPWLSTIEPILEDQQGFHRREDFQGYLGQGGRRSLGMPSPTAPVVQGYSQATAHMGLAEENWCLDGLIATRSAKGIILAKRAALPRPKRIRRPEDPNGDNEQDYAFEGEHVGGTGEAHVVADYPDATLAERSLIQAHAIQDVLARTFNWQGLHPFVYHDRDWYTPEDSDCPMSAAMAAPIPFAMLATQQNLPVPAPTRVVVDHRYGSVAYYPNDSIFAMLDDGGVVLSGGCGEEFIMAHGNIYLQTPGDIWKLPGRSEITWAGWDIVHKANNAVDISANWDDVRVKAEKNILMLGGNNGCGGVLIESKGVGTAATAGLDDNIFTGVVIRAREAPVAIMTDKLFEVMPVASDKTEIRLSAGAGVILTESSYFYRRLHEAAVDDFITSANEFRAATADIGSTLIVTGDVAASGDVGGEISAVLGRQEDILAAIAAAELDTRVTHYEDNTDVQDLEFFFRFPSDMKSEGLKLYESRWQLLARAQSSGVVWSDNPVVSDAAFVSRAHPGELVWQSEGYIQQDPLLYDVETGLYAGRVSPFYSDPEWPEQAVETFESFRIIANPEV